MAKRRKKAPKWLLLMSSAAGVGALAWGVLTLPGWPGVLRLIAGALLLTPLVYYKRRPLRKVRALMIAGCAVLAAALAVQFIGGGEDRRETVSQAGPTPSEEPTATPLPGEIYAGSLAEAERMLEADPEATRVTLTGGAAPARELNALRARYPGVRFDCQVDILGVRAASSATALNLDGKDPGSDLAELLGAFPDLASLSLRGADMDAVLSVHEARPQLALTFELSGVEITPETTELDLRAAQGMSISDLPAALACAPAAQKVYLPDIPRNSRVQRILSACPPVTFVQELMGRQVAIGAEGVDIEGLMHIDPDQTVIDFGETKITDDQVNDLQWILMQLPQLEEVLMFESSLSRENYDRLFDQNPRLFFGFTVSGAGYTVRTDITAFSTLGYSKGKRRSWDDLSFLRYCKRLLALDLGHNNLRDLSFLSNFPNLRILILADNEIRDISPLADLKDLEYVELFINKITDLSPLADHEHLIDLNLCHNKLGGMPDSQVVEPILSCKALERCWISYNELERSQRTALAEGAPNVLFEFYEYNATAAGWRLHPRYKVLKEMMQTRVYAPFQ